ncbi:MAG: hypothetical protein Q7J98_03070 [Kiritimatiellia bacterium]|nr:hypothetical protein [Kiritimatiellia bacterium]
MMIKLTVIGMIIAVFVLTGCVDDRNTRYLNNAYISLTNDIAHLQARVTAVEKACLQLNARLADTVNRERTMDQSFASPESAGKASEQSSLSQLAAASKSAAQPVTFLTTSKPADTLTRTSFGRLVGMTISEVLTLLGKPDSTTDEEGVLSWTYQGLRLTTESGGAELSPALIVFENGCVARALLTKDAQKPSEQKESESGSKAVPANQ